LLEDQRLIQELLARGPDPAAEEEAKREARQQLERANAALAFYAEQERRREREMHNMFQLVSQSASQSRAYG